MSIERFLQLSLSGQIILAAYLLFSGQDVYWGAPVVAALVLISFLVVDKYHLFHLSPFWINTATILITCWCLYDIAFNSSPFQLTVRAANGLTLIELVLLWRKKTFHKFLSRSCRFCFSTEYDFWNSFAGLYDKRSGFFDSVNLLSSGK